MRWVARLVEVLQPLSLHADRLAGMALFVGLRWSELEFAADLLHETDVERGTRMTVQGRPSSRLWLITQGEALVSANTWPRARMSFVSSSRDRPSESGSSRLRRLAAPGCVEPSGRVSRQRQPSVPDRGQRFAREQKPSGGADSDRTVEKVAGDRQPFSPVGQNAGG